MRKFTLLDQYKHSKKLYRIFTPIILVILAIQFIASYKTYPELTELRIAFAILGGVILVAYTLIIRYLNRKIAELERQDTDNFSNKK